MIESKEFNIILSLIYGLAWLCTNRLPFCVLFTCQTHFTGVCGLLMRKNYLTPAEMYGDYYKSKEVRGATAIVALLMGIPYVALQLVAADYAFNILSQGMISQTLVCM